MKTYRITLQEVTTKQMAIEASSKEEAEFLALNSHLGWLEKTEMGRVCELSTMVEGSIIETPPDLSKGLGHDPVVD